MPTPFFPNLNCTPLPEQAVPTTLAPPLPPPPTFKRAVPTLLPPPPPPAPTTRGGALPDNLAASPSPATAGLGGGVGGEKLCQPTTTTPHTLGTRILPPFPRHTVAVRGCLVPPTPPPPASPLSPAAASEGLRLPASLARSLPRLPLQGCVNTLSQRCPVSPSANTLPLPPHQQRQPARSAPTPPSPTSVGRPHEGYPSLPPPPTTYSSPPSRAAPTLQSLLLQRRWHKSPPSPPLTHTAGPALWGWATRREGAVSRPPPPPEPIFSAAVVPPSPAGLWQVADLHLLPHSRVLTEAAAAPHGSPHTEGGRERYSPGVSGGRR
ncbi:uncharacterized protein LOC114590186 [Podarcis muralis]